MFPVMHNTLFVIVYCMATSFDFQCRSSSSQLYKNMNINISYLTVLSYCSHSRSCIIGMMMTHTRGQN